MHIGSTIRDAWPGRQTPSLPVIPPRPSSGLIGALKLKATPVDAHSALRHRRRRDGRVSRHRVPIGAGGSASRAGRGPDIWEVVSVHRSFDDVDRTASWLDQQTSAIETALRYYEAHESESTSGSSGTRRQRRRLSASRVRGRPLLEASSRRDVRGPDRRRIASARTRRRIGSRGAGSRDIRRRRSSSSHKPKAARLSARTSVTFGRLPRPCLSPKGTMPASCSRLRSAGRAVTRAV